MTPEKELHHAEMLVNSFEMSIKYMKSQKKDIKQLEKVLKDAKTNVTKLKKRVKENASKT